MLDEPSNGNERLSRIAKVHLTSSCSTFCFSLRDCKSVLYLVKTSLAISALVCSDNMLARLSVDKIVWKSSLSLESSWINNFYVCLIVSSFTHNFVIINYIKLFVNHFLISCNWISIWSVHKLIISPFIVITFAFLFKSF